MVRIHMSKEPEDTDALKRRGDVVDELLEELGVDDKLKTRCKRVPTDHF